MFRAAEQHPPPFPVGLRLYHMEAKDNIIEMLGMTRLPPPYQNPAYFGS